MKESPVPNNAKRRSSTLPVVTARRKADIKAAIDTLDELATANSQSAELIKLLRSWLTDESGYDEQAWPKLKKALEDARARVAARRLFDA